MRELVSVRKVLDVNPIPNADAIEVITVDGWEVVSKKGEFSPGDECVYFEIDSFLPAEDTRFDFLKKGSVKKDPSGKERIRLKTIRLRKQISQGLALPVSDFQSDIDHSEQTGIPLDEVLDVIKYERPEPQVANAAGNLPHYIQKTDEQRIQNVYHKLRRKHQYRNAYFVPTMKLDGSSCTVIFLGPDMKEEWQEGENVMHTQNGQILVCSRNMQLKFDPNSHFWKAILNGRIDEKLEMIYKVSGESVVIQGEVMGPGIQGNKDKFTDYQFFGFNIWSPKDQWYITYNDASYIMDLYNIQRVPSVEIDGMNTYNILSDDYTLQDILKMAEGPSINAKQREGIVFKSVDVHPPISFKAISNKFLLAGGDD